MREDTGEEGLVREAPSGAAADERTTTEAAGAPLGAPPGDPLAQGGPATRVRAPLARRGVLPPIAYPVLAVVFGGALVWSFSRILLTVNKEAAAAIALLMALNVLVGAAMVAYGSRVRRRSAGFPLVLGAGIAVIASGIVAFGYGDHPPKEGQAAHKPSVQKVTLTAQGTKFLETRLSLTSPGRVQMTFVNKDPQTPHNFVLFNGKDASAPKLFRGAKVNGPATATYSFNAPPMGTYFFHCEFHPTVMFGTVTVTGKAPTAAGGALTVTAKGLKFSPTTLTASAGGPVAIRLVNQDAQIPHNIVVFNGPDANSPALFTGQTVTGPGSATYTFAAPPPGTYFFHCRFHPDTMRGSITIGP